MKKQFKSFSSGIILKLSYFKKNYFEFISFGFIKLLGLICFSIFCILLTDCDETGTTTEVQCDFTNMDAYFPDATTTGGYTSYIETVTADDQNIVFTGIINDTYPIKITFSTRTGVGSYNFGADPLGKITIQGLTYRTDHTAYYNNSYSFVPGGLLDITSYEGGCKTLSGSSYIEAWAASNQLNRDIQYFIKVVFENIPLDGNTYVIN
ncbi:MAG: hypothetical protein K9I95_02655 [Flavobacteriaceae bacterium]|nr:hypothetical protein [Flavobacteriaceae bacterium]